MLRSLLLAALAVLLALPASAQLSGTYTVGGTAPDYATLPAAVSALETQGVSGNTVFQIRPGTYNSGIDLGPVAGVSETARIRFEASDPANPPVLRRPSATSGSNYVVRIGTDWVTLRDLELQAAATAPVGRLIVLDGAENVTVRKCTLDGHALPGSDEGTLIWTDAPETASGFVLDQSTLTGGYTGLDLIVSNVDPGPDTLTVIDNTFINQEANGVSALVDDGISVSLSSEEPDALIRGNTFETDASAWFLYRAAILYGGGAWIEANDIRMGSGVNGISVENASGSVVVNNTVRVLSTATGASAGGGIETGSWATIVYNTISMANGKPALELADAISGLAAVEIHNNILSTSAGPALQDNGALSVESSDHNVFISPSFPVEYAGASLSLVSWQNSTGFDLSTTQDAVSFVNEATGDLHLAGASLDDFDLVAAPLPATLANNQLPPIDTDIDGDPRDAYNPKRGADEGTLLSPLDNADVGGFYAVAGSSPDFASPSEAFATLVERGMKGPVTFRIRTGTYTVRESFPNDLRVGPAATDPASAPLAIRAANPASRPTLVSDANSGANWTFRFRGFDHVELENLDFDASGAGDFGHIVVLKGGADGEGTDDVAILTCTFTGATTGTVSEDRALIWSDDDGHDELVISGNTFTNGWAGVYLPGSPTDDSPNATLTDNTFTGQSAYGLYGSLGGVIVSGSTFTSGASDATAIRLGAAEGYRITGNQISLTSTLGTGLALVGTDADSDGTALVDNTFIRADQGIVLSQGATGARIIHTSIYASGTNATPVTVSGAASRIHEMKNTILRSLTGPALVLGQSVQLEASDGNVLVTTSPTLVEVGASSYADLAAWQTASGFDAVSRSFVPSFVNAGTGDLHLTGASDGDPRLAGLPGTGILADFDGISPLRSLDNPYIGADEATPLLPLAGTYAVGTPPMGSPAAAFATLQEALDAVHYLGVSGSTTLQFYSTFGGLPVTVRPFDGASETDRLVVRPDNVGEVFAYSATDSDSNGAIRIVDADHVSLVGFGIDTSGSTAPYGRAIYMGGDVEDLVITAASYTGLSGQNSNAASLIWANAETTDLKIQGNSFTGGSQGVFLVPFESRSTGTVLEANGFTDQSLTAVTLIHNDDVTLIDLIVESSVSSSNGIQLQDGVGGTLTDVEVAFSQGSALTLSDQSGEVGTPFEITNSFFYGAKRGAYLLNSSHVRFAHNTFRMDTDVGQSLVETWESSDNVLENNILVADGGAPVFRQTGSTAGFSAIGANNLVTSGATFATIDGTPYADLAAFQAGTGLAASSVSVPVVFADVGTGDLHLDGASVGDDALGALPLVDVLTDIDGDTRSTTWTYLGADEGDVPLTAPSTVSYAVTAPAVLGAYAHGSTLNVVWSTLDPALAAGPVRVSVLCPSQAPFVRYASTANDGQAGFVVPVSLGTHGGIDDQASGCTVEVANVADPSRAATSAPFVIRSTAVGGVTTRKLDLATGFSPARYGLQDVIKWFWDETTVPTGNVRLALVCDGRARWVRYPDTANDGQASATLPASFGAYDVCRTEVTSIDDPTFFGRSAPFQVLDTYLPSVDVLTPADGEALTMGTSYDITWETVGVAAGNAIRILLVDLTNGPPNRLIAQTTNTGSYTWSVPSDLDPAAEYRLSVKATANDGTFPTTLIDPLTFVTASSLTASAGASATSSEALPTELAVGAARPNPTRDRATMRVGVPEAGTVEVSVYDAVGRRVAVLASGERSAGWHELTVEADRLAPGVYVVRALAGGTVATRTLSVVR